MSFEVSRRKFLIGTAAATAVSVPIVSPSSAHAMGLPAPLRAREGDVLPLPVSPGRPKIPDQSVAAADYGAVPDDGGDDTVAIQEAINGIAARGGGTVWFDPGRYDVSIQSSTGNHTALVLQSGVRLAARVRGATTLRLADDQGGYMAIFSAYPSGHVLPRDREPLHDVALDGLVIDCNASHNPLNDSGDPWIPPGEHGWWWHRQALRLNGTSRLAVQHCRFTDSDSVQVILLNQKSEREVNSDVTIADCVFDKVGGTGADHDTSTVYVFGNRVTVARCDFRTRFGPGTTGCHTAVETHGDDWTVTGCSFFGYWKALNITGSRNPHSRRQLIRDNYASGVLFFCWLYHNPGDAALFPGSPGGLSDITIDQNTAELSTLGFAGEIPALRSYGIGLRPGAAAIDGLAITGNRIRFNDNYAIVHDRTYLGDSLGAGVVFHQTGSTGGAVSRLTVRGNTIIDAISAAVWGNTVITGGSVDHNVFINPGSNGYFDPPKDYSVNTFFPPYRDAFRTGVYLGDRAENVTVESNITHTVSDRRRR